MEVGPNEDQDSALRPLRNVASATAGLRVGTLPESETRSAVVQVAAAVEMSLRRLLRDFPAAALQVRLRALAPDELRADEVLAELRQHDQISIELAAAVHDLLEVRQRLRNGAPLSPHDATLAYHVADRLEHEATHPRQPVAPAPALEMDDDDLVALAPPVRGRRGRLAASPRGTRIALVGVVVAALLALGVWWAMPRDEGQLDAGIALFRTGEYEAAASHFWRYAESHPDDATPRLYLARIHRRLSRPELAVAQLDTALRLAPDDADVHTELGFLLVDTDRAADAVERFRSALSLDPRSESAWAGLVAALRADGRPDAAERVLDRAPPAVRSRLTTPDQPAELP